jgi:hypothetical protein
MLTQGKNKTAIGVYYGPQENQPTEERQRHIDTLKAQTNQIKQEATIILTGDFNAKIKIDKGEIHQETSSNEKMLEELIEENNLTPISTMANLWNWTRVNRQNPEEKSIIDYILINRDDEELVQDMTIDETGWMRLKTQKNGRRIKESDHNTMSITVRNKGKKKPEIKTMWKKANKQKWESYNIHIQQLDQNARIETYDNLQKAILKAMEEKIGKIKIRINKKRRDGIRTREAKKEKKIARKEFEKAIKGKEHDIRQKLEKYKECQMKVREIIEEEEKARIEKIFQELIKEGGTNSNMFWKIRRKILQCNNTLQYDIITEDDKKIEDPQQAKDYIANFYEKLYCAREANEENMEITKVITQKVKEWTEKPEYNHEQDEITIDEVNKVLNNLKRNKSNGPDNIPNEAIIETSEATREIIRRVLNNILQEQSIPNQWQIGTITRLYKGKGTLGKCSNERGITCASNLGKVMERIMNNRARKDVKISDAQAGGIENRSTVDHLLILKETIKVQSTKRKPVYVAYLDVTKAYDKAWSDGIMYAMHENGLTGPIWNMINKFNKGLKAHIKTKDGLTREIEIKDSIRQGGVLSVLQYATVMDEIAKEIQKQNKGIQLNEGENRVGCLLWMDDVVLMAESEDELQEMLDITQSVANKYHIIFGKAKSKVMVINKKKNEQKTKLGEMDLESTEKYKYLGEIINRNKTNTDQLNDTRKKAEATLQTILTIAGDPSFKNIEMETIWKLVETCIIPVITYGGETRELNKKDNDTYNRILDNILKRILLTPTTTPREALYMELGMVDIENTVAKNRMNMHNRLERTKNKLIDQVMNIDHEKSWINVTKNKEKDLNIEDMSTISKGKSKSITKEAIRKKFENDIEQKIKTKSKLQYLNEGKKFWNLTQRPQYMNKLTRYEASTIFKARTRMLDVKNNFRGKYNDNKCRGCGKEDETQQHVLEECEGIAAKIKGKVTKEEIFNEDTEPLKKTAHKIKEIMNVLISVACDNVRPGELGTHTSN